MAALREPCASFCCCVAGRDAFQRLPVDARPAPRDAGFFSQVAKEQLHNRKAPAIVALAGA